MKCKFCGDINRTGDNFCKKCGKPLAVSVDTIEEVSQKKLEKKKSRGCIVALVVMASLGLFIIIGVAALIMVTDLATYKGIQGQFTLGDTVYEGAVVVDQAGEHIYIDDPRSPMDGFSLFVPEGAYDGPVTIEVMSTPIIDHDFGDLINPISPLMTIHNEDLFADIPLELSFPISKDDDEIAMGFYYDELTGELEPIPFLWQTNDVIVLQPRHFSAVVITKAKIEKLTDYEDIDTGFRPGKDDIKIPNAGSSLAPGGYCAGQTAAMLYYYSKRIEDVP